MCKNNKKGFSVIELLAVIVILGLLIAIAVPVVNKQLNNFRDNYYRKLEASIKSAGQDYVSDKRFAKPTKLLHSRVVKVDTLEDEKYIDEVKDYLGNYCDSTDTSYSYVLVVKTGEKTYDYQTCLRCSEDEYLTDTSGEKHDYCNPAWLDTEDVDYDYSYDDSFMYVYHGTPEEEIKEQVGLTYNVVKKDKKGNTIAKVEPSGEERDIVFPQNINELVGANLNSVVTLRYLIPNGDTVTKQAVIYKHNAPQVSITYAADNTITGKNSGDSYSGGADEWASKLEVKISFSNNDLEKVLENVEIKGAEYYDEVKRKWVDTGCTVTGRTSCTWTIGSTDDTKEFDKDIKIRVVNEQDKKGDPSQEYFINVDAVVPDCVSNNGNTTWVKSRTVNVVCGDNLSGCSQASFDKTYPTASVKNKKTDNINIFDKAGNSKSCNVNFYVDSTPPSSCTVTMKNSSGSVVTSGSTATSDVSFSVKGVDNATDDSGIKTETWVVKQGSTSYNNLANTNDKNNGTYSVVGTCTDNAGNTTTSSTSTVNLDKSITITFNKNTGNGSMNSITCKYNEPCTLTSNGFTKTGYTFTGWNTAANGSGTSYSNNGSITTKSSVTLYAQWRANTYTVAYNINTGTSGSMSSTTCTYDQNCTLRANAFTKTGYAFNGWATSASGSVTYNNSQTVKNLTATNGATVTLYAKWGANTYTIAYNANGGSGTTSSTLCTYDQNCTLRSNGFTKTGYTFQGWATSASGSVVYSNGQSVKNLKTSGTITLYAVWKANTYTVKYYANNGSGTMSDTTCTYDQNCTLRTNAFTRTGYTYQGWATSANGGVAYTNGEVVKNMAASGTVNLYAKWGANGYTIAYNANGGSGSMSNTSCTYGSSCSLRSNSFTRTGYTFAGWATSSSGSVAYSNGQSVSNLAASGTVTLYAKWTANTYTVVYNANGGGGTTSNTTCTYDQNCSLRANGFTKTGFTFQGWATSATGSVSYSNSQTVKNLTPSGTKTLFAVWGGNGYTIAYNANGGTGTMSNTSCTYGSSCTLRANSFTRVGYTFAGWATSASGSSVYTNSQSVSNLATSGTKTLYAKWTANSYSIAYNSNGGSGSMLATDCTYGSSCTLRANSFTKSGYTFQGWATSASGSVAYSNSQSVSNLATSGTKTLYAVWGGNGYTIAYNANGGTGTMSNTSCTYGSSCTLRANSFTRVGYTFAGWATSASGSSVYTNSQSVSNLATSGTTTLYAKWTANSYSIAYNSNGGSGSMLATDCTYGSSCTLRANSFTRSGYTFAGWATSASGSVAYNNSASVSNLATSGTKTLYAVWSGNGYTIAYNSNGGSGTMSNTSCTYGSNCTLRANSFTRSGYTFAGWATSASGSVTYNNSATVSNLATSGTVTLYAKWTSTSYTIAYDSNGGSGSMSNTSCNYGSSCTLRANSFSRTGYTFAGWATSASGSVAYSNSQSVSNLASSGTVTLYAKWTANTYYIAYNNNGGSGSMTNTTCTYGSNCTLRSNSFTKSNATFKGWATSSSATSATYGNSATVSNLTSTSGGTVTLYAVWEIQKTVYTSCPDSDNLFGSAKSNTCNSSSVTNSYDNYGNWRTGLSSYKCYASGSDRNSSGYCNRTCGYDRVCVGSDCGSWLGKTAEYMKKNSAFPSGCSFGGQWWCSCNSGCCS